MNNPNTPEHFCSHCHLRHEYCKCKSLPATSPPPPNNPFSDLWGDALKRTYQQNSQIAKLQAEQDFRNALAAQQMQAMGQQSIGGYPGVGSKIHVHKINDPEITMSESQWAKEVYEKNLKFERTRSWIVAAYLMGAIFGVAVIAVMTVQGFQQYPKVTASLYGIVAAFFGLRFAALWWVKRKLQLQLAEKLMLAKT